MVGIEVKRGDTWSTSFAWQDADGDAIDLTGATALLNLRTTAAATAASLTASSATGELVVTPATGTVALTVDADTTDALTAGVYLCDLEMTFPDGTVESTATFRVTVLDDISHADEVAP